MKTSPITHKLYYALVPQGAIITTRAHGIDISKYDLEFVPESATGQLDFVWQRISYRLTRDEAFEKLLPGVMRVPIRMGYHYLNSGTDWKAQADAYLSYISGLEYHAHAVDFEGTANTLSQSFAYDAWRWRDYVEQKTGKITHLYTGRYLYQDWLIPSQKTYGIDWDTVPLWHAQYFYVPNPDGTPSLPTGRNTGWTFWQYTSSGNGTLYGTGRSYACDLDVFNGTLDELKKYLNIGGTVPPPNGGEMKGTMKNYTVNVRDTGGNIVTQLKVGDVVYGEVYRDNRERIRFSRVYRAAGNVENLGKECNAVTNDAATIPVYYMTLTNEAEPTPEPEPVVPVSMEVNLPKGATLTLTFSDGTKESWTA